MRDLKSQFTDWVRTKPADERYDYCDPFNCALAQFGREVGYPHLVGAPTAAIDLGERIHGVLNSGFSGNTPTFGALASRLSPNPTGRG